MTTVSRAVNDTREPYGYRTGWDDPKKMMLDFGRSTRHSFKFLDNIPTPILGPDYAEINHPNNPLTHATL